MEKYEKESRDKIQGERQKKRGGWKGVRKEGEIEEGEGGWVRHTGV